MQNDAKHDNLAVKNGWAVCPLCGNPKFLKLNPDTTVHNLPRICKRCRREINVNIEAPAPATKASSA